MNDNFKRLVNMNDNLKKLINILNNNSGLEFRYIHSKEEYNEYEVGQLINVYGVKAKIINKQEYPKAEVYTASITYKILAQIFVEEIKE